MTNPTYEPSDADTRTWTGADVVAALAQRGPSPVVMRFLADEVLDERFRIIRLLGQGGMGQVYEAEDLELGARVALKAIRPERGHSAQSIERFKREVHLARQVTHRNVCRIFELFPLRREGAWGKAESPQLLVTMELLDGETLAARLRRAGPLPPCEAMPIIRDLAAALDTAHQAGVLHLDFKSSNVMLASSVDRTATPGGPPGRRAVVTDFGLARSAGRDGDHSSGDSRQGTPAYAAPELAAGATATAAADIYSFGVVVYEMLTGHLPFPAGRGSGATSPRQDAPPSPRAYCPELPLRWEDTILRCLERRPEARFKRAGDVAEALAKGLRKPWRRWRVLAAAGLVLALSGVSVRFDLPGSDRSHRVRQPTVAGLSASPALLPFRGPDLGRPADPEAARLYGEGLQLLGVYDLPAACELLENAAAEEPEAVAVHVALADCWSLRGHDAGAQASIQRAVARSAGLKPSARRFLRARAAELAHQLVAARTDYTALWSSSPDVDEYGLRLAAVQAAAGDPATALETVAQVRSRLASRPISPRIDLIEAEAARRRGALERQRQAAVRVATAAIAMDAELLLARARLLEAEALDRLGRRDEAIKAVAEARGIYESHADDRGLAWSALALPDRMPLAASPRLSTDFAGALGIFRDIGDRYGEAVSLARWGRELIRDGDGDHAAEVLAQSLALAREIGDLVIEAETLSHQGVLEWGREDTVGAAKLFAMAVAAAARSGNLPLQARALANLGNTQASLQQLHAARQSYEEALAISAQIGSRADRGSVLIQYAGVLFGLGEIDAAEEQVRETLMVAEETANSGLSVWAQGRRAEIDACRGNFEQALSYYAWPAATRPKHLNVHQVLRRAIFLVHVAPAEAEQELRQIEPAINPHERWAFLHHRERLAAALLAQQKVAAAAAVLRPHRSELDAYPEPFIRQSGLLLLARIDAAEGRLEEALRVIDGIVEEARSNGALAFALEARMHKVHALFAASEADRAREERARLTVDATVIGCPGIAAQVQPDPQEQA